MYNDIHSMDIKIKQVIDIAREAATAVMGHLTSQLVIHTKPDNTPYTDADLDAHRIVMMGLGRITPDIPVISEEDSRDKQLAALRNSRRWVTDPLDGSKTSIKYAQGDKKQNGFGVNIALVEDGIPILGAVLYPAKGGGGILYYTGDDGKAYKQEGDKSPREIRTTRPPFSTDMKAAVSWREKERPDKIAGRIIVPVPEVGGGRVCITAEGVADVAWIDRPFSHWDLAAPHAIIKSAGGELVLQDSGSPVIYDNEQFFVLPCIGGSRETLKLLGISDKLNPDIGRAR